MSGSRLALWALMGGLCAAPRPSAAQTQPPPAAELSYTRAAGAESCPDESSLRRAVTERLGADPFSGTPTQRFRAEVTRIGDDFVGQIALVNAEGAAAAVRQFDGSADCTELVAAMALAISLAINPALRLDDAPVTLMRESTSAGEPLQPADSAPQRLAPPVSLPAVASPQSGRDVPNADAPQASSERRPGTRVGLDAGIFGLGAIGVGPSANFAGAFAVRVSGVGALSVNVEGRADAPAAADIPSGGSVKTRLYAGALAPCWHVGFVAGCAALLVGTFHAETRGVTEPGSDAAAYAALGPRITLEHRFLPRLTFELRGELLGTFTPPTVWRNDNEKVWSASRFSGSLGLGILTEIL